MAEKQSKQGGKKPPPPKNEKKANKEPQNKPQHVNNGNKSKDLLEYSCPVCVELMSPPIYVCESGHSICNECCKKLTPPNCPFCQALIKQTRNFALEAMIEKLRIPCPNKGVGCNYTVLQGELNKHAAECPFRTAACFFGDIFGKCSWSGPIQSMVKHCKERHDENTNKIKVDTDIVLKNFKPHEDERFLELLEVGPYICYYHFKVDTITNNAYWAIQVLGTPEFAKNWTYEVHVLNRNAPERTVKFAEFCKPGNSSVKGIFDSGECAIIALEYLKTFVDQKKNLVFKVMIKNKNVPKKKKDKDITLDNLIL